MHQLFLKKQFTRHHPQRKNLLQQLQSVHQQRKEMAGRKVAVEMAGREELADALIDFANARACLNACMHAHMLAPHCQ